MPISTNIICHIFFFAFTPDKRHVHDCFFIDALIVALTFFTIERLIILICCLLPLYFLLPIESLFFLQHA